VVIVQHYADSVEHYAEAAPFPGSQFPLPDRCPHPDCHAPEALIRWGTYTRQARTGLAVYPIRVQRVRCTVCGRTHSLLPDFLHPFRHYVMARLQEVVMLYLLAGLGFNRLMKKLPSDGPGRSTVREWIAAFGYGAGVLLWHLLLQGLMRLAPLAELPNAPPPAHLARIPRSSQRQRLHRAQRFWHLGEHLYAQVKVRKPHLHFTAPQLLTFVLHWLQSQGVPPRLFWSPRLSTTPTQPF